MTVKTQQQVPLTILRRRQVEARVGLKRTQIYEMIGECRFPAPIRLGKRAVGWLEHEIDAWLVARVEASRSGSSSTHPALSETP